MYEELRNTSVFVTGATGLIGQTLVRRLLLLDANVIAVIRDINKAKMLFNDNEKIKYIVSDITELLVQEYKIDYVIHAASNTSSKAFVNDPVGIINTAVEGTRRTLEIARLSKVKGYIYLSSMEIYGAPKNDEKVNESHGTNLNTMNVRSAYPESKRLCESLCTSYASQYGIPAKVVRLTQTFGPGVQYNDGRVFADFARCAIEGRDIVLHTKGETKRSYLYTEDAVDAILTVLLKGGVGEAYNAANEDTYCSIYEMAKMVACECAEGKIQVLIHEENTTDYGYAPKLKMNLDTTKLKQLGCEPRVSLKDSYLNMIESLKIDKEKV